MSSSIKLNIAEVIVEMESRFPMEKVETEGSASFRFTNFIYRGKRPPEVRIRVNIVNKLPQFPDAEVIFITYHFADGSENWRLLKKGKNYIYKSPLEEKEQLMLVNKDFNEVEAYLLPKAERSIEPESEEFRKKHQGFVWHISDIIYDFLQVLLINYLAKIRKDGIFVHGMGVKDINNDGLLFAGKSRAGKTTLAKIYHNHSKALVLNDDRIIVRKRNNNFYLYGSPWHGEFSDYLESHIDKARLRRIFFLQKGENNSLTPISANRAFKYLYPAMFPTFWDREGIENITLFLRELVSKVDCFRLKFKKDKSVVGFVRRIKGNKNFY